MALDNLNDLVTIEKPKWTLFQKIVLGIEIALAFIALIGILFKIASFPRASEMIIISLTSLSVFYVLFPIPLFRSKKVGGHILGHIAGLALFVVLIGALFKIEAWPYANEMYISAIFSFLPMVATLIILMAINFKDIEKRNFYLRIGLRYLIIVLILKF
jgi:hypothetical protein